MQKVNFKSDDGTINCQLIIDSDIPKEKLESAFRSLMLHLETSVGLYHNKRMFEGIIKLRGEFYSKVLKFIVDENLDKGYQVPSNILKHLSEKNKCHWGSCYDED